MSQISINTESSSAIAASKSGDEYKAWRWYLVPLLLVFVVEYIAPQLIAWRMVPRTILWLGDLAIFAMAAVAVARMLLLDRIPRPFLIILAITALGFTVSYFQGQSPAIMVYGFRRLFQYPLVGLYVYMMPKWPPWSAKWIMYASLFALGVNTLVQLMQYASGATPGDFLAGFFGPHGVGPLALFAVLVGCFGIGNWLARGEYRYLLVAVILGVVASTLGQMKLYPLTLAAIATIGFIIELFQSRKISRLIAVSIIVPLFIAAYIYLFNVILAPVIGNRFDHYLDVDVLNDYFTGVNGSLQQGGFRLTRFSEPAYVWQNNLRSVETFLFGNGIGSRASSATLGIQGEWFDSTYFGGVGRSLPVLLYETGTVGLLTLGLFAIVASAALYKKARLADGTFLAAVQYGLIIFTVLWPLWLWYNPVWIQAIPMLLYWSVLGFASNQENNEVVREAYGS